MAVTAGGGLVILMWWRGDAGVGTVLGLVLASVLLGAGAVIHALVSVSVTHQRAAVAADLAAVAAMTQDCAGAERVARAQGAISFACDVSGGDAVVTVAIPAPGILTRLATWAGQEPPVIASSSRAGHSGG